MKPPGYYVQRSYGLFPAPWPQDTPELARVSKCFELLGMFIAKCLQDNRRVDLPLAMPLLKLMCTVGKEPSADAGEDTTQTVENDSPQQESNNNVESVPVSNQRLQSQAPSGDTGEASSKLLLASGEKEEISKDGGEKEEVVLEELSAGESQSEVPWFAGILDAEDLAAVNPFRARFLTQVFVVTETMIGIHML